MNIVFFIDQFSERGTEVAIYDYAKYNEEILKNKSYIVCYSHVEVRTSYEKFKARFEILEIAHMREMKEIIRDKSIHYFYVLTHGGHGDKRHSFSDRTIWGNCKTIKHCVFDTTSPDGDHYITISNHLNQKYNTSLPVIPHIVERPVCTENLRKELNLGDATVFGRYGGFGDFNIKVVHQAIIKHLETPNVYFLFMNTKPFYTHPRIIYLDMNLDFTYKEKFINTCDAMIHARVAGETFGLSIAEFSIRNKPIITCASGDLEHLRLLGKKAVLYDSGKSLLEIFENIKEIIPLNDWTRYQEYSPENVMSQFKLLFK